MRISDWSSDVCSSDLAAKRELLLETFILCDEPAGQPRQKAVIAAAQRGVNVQMTLDGWGSATLPQSFIEPMIEAGVRIHIYDPVKWVFGRRTQIFRRLHRKLIVIDQRVAWCGGINFAHDHLRSYGEQSKQDYAIEVEGPVEIGSASCRERVCQDGSISVVAVSYNTKKPKAQNITY